MSARPDFLQRSLIVAAHPDDELLWFGSILRDVDEVILVYHDFWAKPGLGAARQGALGNYPRGGVSSLMIAEAGAFGCADWQKPQESEFGIAFTPQSRTRDIKRFANKTISGMGLAANRPTAPDSVETLYQLNFARLVAALRPKLSFGMNVFTHNPWGEYGHEDHVQVFRALDLLRREIGFTLWMSNYCTDRSMPLAMRYFAAAPGPFIRLPVDVAFADRVADVYKANGCWTWADDWSWFPDECFMQAPVAGADPAPQRHLFPLNFFTIGAQQTAPSIPMTIGVASATAALTLAMLEAI
jgi:hypothetical protein